MHFMKSDKAGKCADFPFALHWPGKLLPFLSLMPSNRRFFNLRNAHLLPFLAVAAFGLFILLGWWSGQAAWVQPRPNDPPFAANAAMVLLLLGVVPLLICLRLHKTARGIAVLGALLGWIPVIEFFTGLKFKSDNLFVTHENLIAGVAVGRPPICLALVLAVAGTLLLRYTWKPWPRRLALLLALTGSLACAYGATSLLADQVGLDRLDLWQTDAQLGLPAAIALFVLGCGLFLLAAPKAEGNEWRTGPRWLWLPAVVAGATVSVLFWVSLREREAVFVNHTTQLTINHIATLYSSETETQIDNLRGMAARWADAVGTSAPVWEKDARAQLEVSPSYQLISRVDDKYRTVWIWPAGRNEDAAGLDHSSNPLRLQAMNTARESLTFAVAGPLQSPLRPPSFAIYSILLQAGRFDGFVVGQLDYARLIGLIDHRLNISQRYQLDVSVSNNSGGTPEADLPLYSSTKSDEQLDANLRQSATFNFFGQRLTLHLTPRFQFTNADRQTLPRLALFSGLGVSLLIGLVINLAQTARARQRAAESTAGELQAENEERRRVEAALRSSQASARLLTHVARRTENIVFITDPAGKVEWTNDSFTRFTGRTLSEVAGHSLLDLLTSPPASPEVLGQVGQALEKHASLTTEVMLRSRDHDRNYHLRFELQPVMNDGGRTENFIAMGTDITSSVQTEATLRRAKAEADAASRAKTEFLATVSHEIRTPMNGVIGMTSLLFDTPLNQEQREFVGTIRTSGQALLGIINEILDFSNMESGHTEIERQPVEIAQCVEEAVDVYALKAAAKKIEIACHIDPAVPPWILLDMSRLRQVLVNLLDNAVKFTAQGRITVDVRLAPIAAGTTIAPLPGGSLQSIDFFISDTGIGIGPQHRDRLFKPFSQVDSSNTRKYGGNGLGLAICDRLCQLMGGTIDMQDNPGGGSIFRFSILAEPTSPPVTTAFAPLPRAFHLAKVLIVDDLPLNRLTLSEALATFQLTIIEAGDIASGRQLSQQHTISAAIIDQELAGENGLKLVNELHTYQPELPVILLTNPVDSATQNQAKDPAHLVRIPKPIRPFLILETLHRLLSTSSSAAPISIPSLSTVPVPPALRTAAAVTAPPHAATKTASAPIPLGTTIPLRILVAEDNPVNQKVALRFLARLGYSATIANNGREALHMLDEQPFDLVLMDMQMPEMDGLIATREIRQRYPAARQPRIFALTANAVTGDRERCLEAGMNDYLSKPVKIESIEQLIRKHFRPKPPA